MLNDPIERQLKQLRESADRFAREPVLKKLGWLYQMRERVARVAERWVALACQAKHIELESPVSGENWFNGPVATLRMLRLLSVSLSEIQRDGKPRLPGKSRQLDSGQLVVPAFPFQIYDRGLLPGVQAEVRLQTGVTADTLRQASFYQQESPAGRVALVLGAGNVSSIPVLDALYQLFVEGHVVILKMNPVNAYLSPVLEEAMKPLIDQGYLAICHGGAEVGSQLCHHESVDEVHVTGSDRTHDAIVWGSDRAQRDARRERGEPVLRKPISSELGNVTPVIVVPGPYDDRQVTRMAESIAGMVTQNASFNCVAAKMLVLPRAWPGSQRLVKAIGDVLARVPQRYAYYPGAGERYQVLTREVSRVQTFGTASEGSLPWAIVQGLDAADRSTLHFRMEPFCSILSVVELDAAEADGFLSAATDFCNDTLWGTLSANLFVHPKQISDSTLASQLEASVQRLRYGVVAINQWSGVAYALGTTPWGGHPSTTLDDIESGRGWVHNSLMLEDIEKCVLRGPLDSPLRVPWSPLHRTAHETGRRMCQFEANPNLFRLGKLGARALRG